jgi:hypothetical protein
MSDPIRRVISWRQVVVFPTFSNDHRTKSDGAPSEASPRWATHPVPLLQCRRSTPQLFLLLAPSGSTNIAFLGPQVAVLMSRVGES